MTSLRLSLLLTTAALALPLSGCVVAPVGPRPVAYRPAVVAPAPVVVRPAPRYCNWRGCWR